jgi:hypothetical protein
MKIVYVGKTGLNSNMSTQYLSFFLFVCFALDVVFSSGTFFGCLGILSYTSTVGNTIQDTQSEVLLSQELCHPPQNYPFFYSV